MCEGYERIPRKLERAQDRERKRRGKRKIGWGGRKGRSRRKMGEMDLDGDAVGASLCECRFRWSKHLRQEH